MTHAFLNADDRAKLALELTMRDALSGLEELALIDSYWFDPACIEVLGIEPPEAAPANVAPLRPSPPAAARILHFPERRRRAG